LMIAIRESAGDQLFSRPRESPSQVATVWRTVQTARYGLAKATKRFPKSSAG